MPAHPTTRPRSRRPRRVLALLAALTAIAALALPTTGAAAGPTTVVADRIVLSVAGLDPPGGTGRARPLLSPTRRFAVTVDAPRRTSCPRRTAPAAPLTSA